MVGTHFETMGGVASVVSVYRSSGMFDRRCVRYFPTHRDGGAAVKIYLAMTTWLSFIWPMLMGQLKLVHAHVASRSSYWRKCFFLVPAIWRGVPTILHLHGAEFRLFYDEECRGWQKRLIRYVFDRCSLVVVLSDEWQRWVRSITVNPRVEVLFNPVVPPSVGPKKSSALPPSLLALGRLGQRKGTYDLLEAAARLRADGLDFRLRLGGDGELEQARRRAVELDLADRVDFLGWVSGAAKEAELQHASVFALPSYNEGLPMAILEAMAAGLPVVSTPIGGIPDAVRDAVDGYLVKPGDIDALTRRLGELLGDSNLRMRMGQSARQRAIQLFSADAVLPRLESLYDELLAES